MPSPDWIPVLPVRAAVRFMKGALRADRAAAQRAAALERVGNHPRASVAGRGRSQGRVGSRPAGPGGLRALAGGPRRRCVPSHDLGAACALRELAPASPASRSRLCPLHPQPRPPAPPASRNEHASLGQEERPQRTLRAEVPRAQPQPPQVPAQDAQLPPTCERFRRAPPRP